MTSSPGGRVAGRIYEDGSASTPELRWVWSITSIIPAFSARTTGRTKDWLQFKNPAAPAVRREAEEDWGKERWR